MRQKIRAVLLITLLAAALAPACGPDADDGMEKSRTEALVATNLTRARPTPNPCILGVTACPAGLVCLDYDCDGKFHCATPGMGNVGNCCYKGSGACGNGTVCEADIGGVGGGRCVPPDKGCRDHWPNGDCLRFFCGTTTDLTACAARAAQVCAGPVAGCGYYGPSGAGCECYNGNGESPYP